MMNTQKYVEVLRSHVVPQVQDWFPDGRGIFMQDGAPCHTAKVCKAFLASNETDLLAWQQPRFESD
jgi:hypothetical protein